MKFLVIAVAAFCMCLEVIQGAPRPEPVDWKQLGTDILNFGRNTALPAAKTGCQFLSQATQNFPIYAPPAAREFKDFQTFSQTLQNSGTNPGVSGTDPQQSGGEEALLQILQQQIVQQREMQTQMQEYQQQINQKIANMMNNQ